MSMTKAEAESAGSVAPPAASDSRRRIVTIDVLRGMALIAMASYHFAWDLEFFGYVTTGTTGAGLWKVYARLIAGSFLFLAGFSLVLGHYPLVRPRAFAIRFLKIAGAALIISIATWFAFPDSFIFFGILHAIAAASLVGVLFLRLPPVLTLIVAAAAFAAPTYLRSAVFDTPALWWVGLSQTLPRSNDYVPLLPWLAPFLVGLSMARLAVDRNWMTVATTEPAAPPLWKSALATAGRHSLPIYLLHQPLLIGLVYLASLVLPAEKPDILQAFRTNCVATCSLQDAGVVCGSFCDCTLNKLLDENLFTPLNEGDIDVANDPSIARIAGQCTMESRTQE